MWPWKDFLTFLTNNFLMSKVRIMLTGCCVVCGTKWVVHVKHFITCLSLCCLLSFLPILLGSKRFSRIKSISEQSFG
jgi:hypothetical protein